MGMIKVFYRGWLLQVTDSAVTGTREDESFEIRRLAGFGEALRPGKGRRGG